MKKEYDFSKGKKNPYIADLKKQITIKIDSKLLDQALSANDYHFSSTIQHQFAQFLQLLFSWNKIFNLTRIITAEEMIYLHLMDSLSISPFLQGKKMLDVGSGGGLPGIPLAIAYPETEWTLLDKNSKKTRFLIQAAADLGLQNVKVVHARLEDFHPEKCFDTIVARAFASIRTLVEATENMLCANGVWIAMKGKYPQDELNDLPTRFLVQKIARLDIKGISVERHGICLTKREHRG